MSYLLLKHLHVTCVVLSGAGFFLRGLLMLRESPLLARRWLRTVPHLVDTTLLASALAMSVMSAQYPFVQGWLTAKVIGLLAYIVLGMFALRRGRTRRQRLLCFVLALAVFGWIVSTALARSPLGPLALFA
jgi:uncharacterized membrane protein SirB2